MENSSEIIKIEIDQNTLNNLNTTRKWSMFLAIIGFIFLGLMIVMGLIAGTFLSAFSEGNAGSGFPESLILILFLVLAVIYFFPVFFLYRFSKHTSRAIYTRDKHELYLAFKNLKSYFKYLGVLIIIILSFYVLAIVIMGVSMSFLKGF